MGFLDDRQRQAFEENMPRELKQADIWMISGCEDRQTSADVSNVNSFKLPDPAGRAGGACTATLLKVLYQMEDSPWQEQSFIQVMDQMRTILKSKGFSQIPQLSSTRPIDMNHKFEIVPDTLTGHRRAVLIGINYTGHRQGQLSGCHNDVKNIKRYLMKHQGFQEKDMLILMDNPNGQYHAPTRKNITDAFIRITQYSKPGDSVFIHYSGHGGRVRDTSGDEADGYDETLIPVDFRNAGQILDDDVLDMLVKPMPADVNVTVLVRILPFYFFFGLLDMMSVDI